MTREEPGNGHDEVGSVGEEAAKLFDVFSEVLAAGRAQAQGATGATADADPAAGAERPRASRWSGEGLSALAAEAVGALRDVDAHVDTGSEECCWCPVCRAVHALRETSPEVRAHLVGAARSLLSAGTALVDQLDRPGPRPDRPARPGGPTPGVEHIDLDDDGAPDPEEDGR